MGTYRSALAGKVSPVTHGMPYHGTYHRAEWSEAQCQAAQQDPVCPLRDQRKQAWIPVYLSPSETSGHYGAGYYGKGFVLHLAWIAKYLLKKGIECGAPTLQMNSLAIRIQIQSNSLLLELLSFVIIRHSGRQCECAWYFDIYCIGKLYTNAHLSQQCLGKCLRGWSITSLLTDELLTTITINIHSQCELGQDSGGPRLDILKGDIARHRILPHPAPTPPFHLTALLRIGWWRT